MKKVFSLFVLLLFVVTAHAESWHDASAWVRNLSSEEQTVALLFLNTEFNRNLMTTIVPNAQTSPENTLWLMKTQASGNFMLAELATKNKELAGIFRKSGNDLSNLVRGEIIYKVYENRAQETEQRLKKAIKSIEMKSADEILNKYRTSLEKTRTALIAFSKLIGTK